MEMTETTAPSPQDADRDLSADLELCEPLPPGPWDVLDWEPDTVDEEAGQWAIVEPSDPYYSSPQVLALEAHAWNKDAKRALAEWIAAARTGWPAAIKRALTAEERVERLLALLRPLQWCSWENTTCPECDNKEQFGHRPDCALAAELEGRHD